MKKTKGPKRMPVKLLLKTAGGLVGAAVAAYVGITRDLLPPGVAVHLAPTYWRMERALVAREAGPDGRAVLALSAFSYGQGMASFGRVVTIDLTTGAEIARRHFSTTPELVGIETGGVRRAPRLWVRAFYSNDAWALSLPGLERVNTLQSIARGSKVELGEVSHVALLDGGALFVRTRNGPKYRAQPESESLSELPRGTPDPPARPRCYSAPSVNIALAPGHPPAAGAVRPVSAHPVCDGQTGQALTIANGNRLFVSTGGQEIRLALHAVADAGRVAWTVPEPNLTGGRQGKHGRTLVWAAAVGAQAVIILEDGNGKDYETRNDLYAASVRVADGTVRWAIRID